MGIDLNDRHCIVIGGGTVAERRITTLLRGGAVVSVISPELTSQLQDCQNEFEYVAEPYNEKVLEERFLNKRFETAEGPGTSAPFKGIFLVIAATDSQEVNLQVYEQCKSIVPLLNIASDQERSSFHFPAVVKRGPLHISVLTSGQSPLLGKKIVEKLSTYFGEEYTLFLHRLGELRKEAYNELADPNQVKCFLKAVIDNEAILENYKNKNISEAEKLISVIFKKYCSVKRQY